MPRKKKAKRNIENYENFLVEVATWVPSYSLGLNIEKRLGDGHYFEHYFIELSGVFLEPPKLAGRPVTVSLGGNRNMSQAIVSDDIYTHEVRGIGYVNSRGSQSSCFLSLPFDALPAVSTMLALSRCKFLVMHGEALRYGSALVRNARFAADQE